jgi:hypothetical protein
MTEPTLGIRLALLGFIALLIVAIVAYHYFMDPPRPGVGDGGAGAEPGVARHEPAPADREVTGAGPRR